MATLVEGQKSGRRTGKLRRHVDFAVTDSEMHGCTAGEVQQRLDTLPLGSRIAVEAILVDGVVDALGEVGLEFGGGHREPVEEQHEIEAVLVHGGVTHLPHHPQPVGGIAGEDVRVHRQRGLELGQCDGLAESDQFHALTQHIEGAPIIELLADAVEQHTLRTSTVVLGERLPPHGLRRLHPREQIRREKSAGAVVESCITLTVEPAMRGKMLTNLFLEADLFVQVHAAITSAVGASASASPRTSILPVTAPEISAVRRSWRSAIAPLASAMRGSIAARIAAIRSAIARRSLTSGGAATCVLASASIVSLGWAEPDTNGVKSIASMRSLQKISSLSKGFKMCA